MKADIHPNYRDVVFYDTSSEFKFLTKSTIETDETIVWEENVARYCWSSGEIQQKIRKEVILICLQLKSLPEHGFRETFLFLPHGKYTFV